MPALPLPGLRVVTFWGAAAAFGLFAVAFYAGVGFYAEIDSEHLFARPPSRERMELFGGFFLGSTGVLGAWGLVLFW